MVSKGTITFFSIYKVLSHWKRHQRPSETTPRRILKTVSVDAILF
jgi:hypothetical protein